MQRSHQTDNDVKMLVAEVACVNAPWISPPNRGKHALVTLHNDHVLWTEDGQALGFGRILSIQMNQMVDLVYVPSYFVGQDLAADNLYLLKWLCPFSGRTVRQEVQRLAARAPHPVGKAAGFALGYVAGLFVDRLIDDTLTVIRNATHSGYYDTAGRLWFDAPIEREHLSVRSVGELRQAGLLK